MKNLLFVIFSFLISCANAQLTQMPDITIQMDFFHPSGYKDSIIIGLSLNANDGFDEGFDVIDTSAMEFPLDVRIYDPMVQQQIGGPAHNLKHSYLALPDVSRGEVFKHYKAFQVIVKSNDINFDTGPVYQNDCETLSQGLGSTYFKGNTADTEFLEAYEFHNSEGWAFSFAGVFSSNVFFNAYLDSFDAGITKGNCVSINSENIGTHYAYLTFDIQLINWLYVNVNNYTNQCQILPANNHLKLENCNKFKNILIFDMNGRLVFSDEIYAGQYNINLPMQRSLQPYILNLTNSEKQIFFTYKITY